MNAELQQALFNMSDVDFREVHHAIEIANMCRTMMRSHSISEDTFAERLHLKDKTEVRSFLNGSYPYTLRDLAAIQSMITDYEVDAAMKKSDQIVQFPDYILSKPIQHE